MNTKKSLFPFILLLIVSVGCFAQETMQQQFDRFNEKETSEWQDFQMIKKPKLEKFWLIVSDTLKAKDQSIAEVKAKLKQLNNELATTKENLAATTLALEVSETKVDSIGFVGMQIDKVLYNMIVWIIIFGLIAVVGVVYVMFQRGHAVTRKAQKALIELDEEYKIHKEKAREAQAKIKRELQTALNTLQDHRINI